MGRAALLGTAAPSARYSNEGQCPRGLRCPPWCTEYHGATAAELLHQYSLADTWSREDETGGPEIGLAIRSFADSNGVDTPTVDIHVATDCAEVVVELTPGDAVTFALSVLRLARLAGAEIPAA